MGLVRQESGDQVFAGGPWEPLVDVIVKKKDDGGVSSVPRVKRKSGGPQVSVDARIGLSDSMYCVSSEVCTDMQRMKDCSFTTNDHEIEELLKRHQVQRSELLNRYEERVSNTSRSHISQALNVVLHCALVLYTSR